MGANVVTGASCSRDSAAGSRRYGAMLLTGSRQLAYSSPVKWQILPVGQQRFHSSARPASFPLKDEGFCNER